MNFFRRNNKMNVNRGVTRAAPRVPVIPPLYVPTIQVARTCESGESTCNQSFPVLDCCLPHLQDRTSAVDHVLAPCSQVK